MIHYNDGQHRLSNSDVKQDERFDELRLRGLYESPHLESDRHHCRSVHAAPDRTRTLYAPHRRLGCVMIPSAPEATSRP